MAVDNLASALGNPGKFQVILYTMILCNPLFLSWNHLGMAFIGAKTKHHCQLGNSTTQIPHLVPVVKKGGTSELDGCHLFSGYNTTDKVPCTNGWTYYLKGRENTVIAQVSKESVHLFIEFGNKIQLIPFLTIEPIPLSLVNKLPNIYCLRIMKTISAFLCDSFCIHFTEKRFK